VRSIGRICLPLLPKLFRRKLQARPAKKCKNLFMRKAAALPERRHSAAPGR